MKRYYWLAMPLTLTGLALTLLVVQLLGGRSYLSGVFNKASL